jgi:hypothetical protein
MSREPETMMSKTFSFSRIVGASLALGLALVAVADGTGGLGQVVYRQGEAGRFHESTSVIENNPALIKTLSRLAIVHLDNGNVLRMEENSAAIFEGYPSGEIRVQVLSGKLSMIGNRGKVRTAGSGSVFSLRPVSVDAESVETLLADPDQRSTRGKRSRR